MSRPTPLPRLRSGPKLLVIGGSAGAFDAISKLLEGLPRTLDVPIVIVLHLPSHRPSQAAELFSHRAARPVCEAQDKDPLSPFGIYIAPPDYHLLIERGPSLSLSVDEPVNFSRPSIDVLFESAADVIGKGVIAILLSGANADGARGLAAIARAGGETIVQDPKEAPSPAMPEAGLRLTPTAKALTVAQIGQWIRARMTPKGSP